ncbi:MAG TPA: hypothetical protein VI413_05070 [Paludibacter sp.]
MKTIIKLLLVFLPLAGSFASTQDTIYVMRSGEVIYKKAVSELDSISFENWSVNRRSITEKIATDDNYSIFYQGLVATGLVDSLKADRDKTYDFMKYMSLLSFSKDMGQWFYDELPRLKRSGFTLFMESDSVFILNGIKNLSELKTYAAGIYNAVYPEDAAVTDLRNRKNSLNRFIAYHIINKKLSLRMLIDAYDTDHMLKTIDMYEYLETFCPGTLIEIKKERSTNQTNIINYVTQTGNSVRIINQFGAPEIYNGYYYGIDKPMCYDINVLNELSGKRLRFDFAGFFSELTNNNLRGNGTINSPSQNINYKIPRGYLSRINFSEQTNVSYLTPYDKFQDYQGDEIVLAPTTGKLYDFTITTPPVPAGTYEVRYGHMTNGKRGVAEMYVDGISAGAPVNLNSKSTNGEIGYEFPHTIAADYEGYENDKVMRNHGYMKGPACYKVPKLGWTTGVNARYSENNLRKILGTFNFTSAGTHTFTVKGLSSGEFQCDFIEFVPVNALENEDIY